ncbi:MAG: hypothetical protein KC649_00350 [Candidatus Omnitrophica bacterium]|nr:hypothetical protein [Candidatus Omnitrophota bacterium]
MMLSKWFPWQHIVRRVAQAHGFIDPIKVLSQLQKFSQPSEVAAPIELIRLASVLQVRGLMNTQVIQHNLDWVWPFWVQQQFDPKSRSFIPRAFSMTHINLTHRNWTAVGIPGCDQLPIIDPRGLITPHYDGWSLESWIVTPLKDDLIPSRCGQSDQILEMDPGIKVITRSYNGISSVAASAHAEISPESGPELFYRVRGMSEDKAFLVVSLRPYNPEGVSFIHEVELMPDADGWVVNGNQPVYFSDTPDEYAYSDYHEGDVYLNLSLTDNTDRKKCDIGMVTAAAVYELKPGEEREIEVRIPMEAANGAPAKKVKYGSGKHYAWDDLIKKPPELQVPDTRYTYIYQSAIRTLLLHSLSDVYPGPYTYKHFWFRDAAFILDALIKTGFTEEAKGILDTFPQRQRFDGYFKSQDGEWDSNGQAIWAISQYCRFTDSECSHEWSEAVRKGAEWILKKRIRKEGNPHNGLFPSGFSAEHLGPNDYYYWDDFWGAEGLKLASELLDVFDPAVKKLHLKEASEDFMKAISSSLESVFKKQKKTVMPASPNRRPDAGCIGSLVPGYPLNQWDCRDERLTGTAEYIYRHFMLQNGFFHDVSHSGINAYLSLHLAQVFLRAGNSNYWKIFKAVTGLASPTGQWPEAIHPGTGGGCMGDGQHVWAAADWILMLRNMFIREEGSTLIVCSGIPSEWLNSGEDILFGPAPTRFGSATVKVSRKDSVVSVSCEGHWFSRRPHMQVRLPGLEAKNLKDGKIAISLSGREKVA